METEVVLPSDNIEQGVEVEQENTEAAEENKEEISEDIDSESKKLQEKIKQQEEYIKKLKDEKAQSKREEVNAERLAEETNAKIELSSSLIEQAINNGGLSDDIILKAEENGLDARDLKIQYYESEKAINNLYEQAGGKDAYFNMVDAVKESATEQEVSMFKAALGNPEFSQLAMYALKQKYAEVTGSTNVSNDNRITTSTSTQSSSNTSYKSEAEYFADRRAAMKLTGADRAKAMDKISAKLSKSNIGKK